MKAYSTREVAELLGLSTARIRSLMRSVTPQRSTLCASGELLASVVDREG